MFDAHVINAHMFFIDSIPSLKFFIFFSLFRSFHSDDWRLFDMRTKNECLYAMRLESTERSRKKLLLTKYNFLREHFHVFDEDRNGWGNILCMTHFTDQKCLARTQRADRHVHKLPCTLNIVHRIPNKQTYTIVIVHINEKWGFPESGTTVMASPAKSTFISIEKRLKIRIVVE